LKKVFLNDKIVDADKAFIAVDDIGFLYGGGVFETLRAKAGVVFCLDEHLSRMFNSAEALGIYHEYTADYIKDAIGQVLGANELSDARMRITLTSGSMGTEEKVATLLITALGAVDYPSELYTTGIMAIICPFKQNLIDPVYGHKTLCYYPRILALDIARKRGAAEAMWFTVDNRLAEGCVSNIFIVKDSVLYTPPLTTPVLAGVARNSIQILAEKNSIEMVEKDLDVNDLLDADEVFVTNVIMKVMPVVAIEKSQIADGKRGEVTEKLQGLFDDFIFEKCGVNK
jgi:branched-chain amino acid aminotransferase